MKRHLLILLALLLVLFAACTGPEMPTETPTDTAATIPEPTPEPTPTPTPEPTPTDTPDPQPSETEPEPLHSEYYIEGVSAEDVLSYFAEVCLDREYGTDGDATLVQKWMEPIRYRVHGSPTEEDLAVLKDLEIQLNTIYGFPGLREAEPDDFVELDIHFCQAQELIDRMGSDFSEMDYGAVTFWFTDNIITDGIICCRSDIDQLTRNSVIVEEIYNLLGPAQDTVLREDSVIYQYSDDNRAMSEVDVLLLQLLYHPDIGCGMSAGQCEVVIRDLYY